MNKLLIKTRLTLLAAVLLGLSLLLAATGLLELRGANTTLRSIYQDRIVPLEQIKRVADAYAVDIVDAAHKARDGALTLEAAAASISKARGTVEQEWRAYSATEMTAEEEALAARAEPLMKAADGAAQALLDILRRGDAEGLRHYAAQEMYPAIDPVAGIMGELSALQLRVAGQAYADSQQAYEAKVWLTVGLVSVLGLGAALFAWALVRSITRPLADAVELAEAVAAGDLTRTVRPEGRDETARLMQALQTMTQGLAGMVTQVVQSSESIATGTSQIAIGNADLSQRTEEQASALQQTSATMTQLGSTVRNNSDNARQAEQLAQSASGLAVGGGQVVGRVVDTMRGIHESSRKISEIIGVIDGIAFQTNILALNAAVEAARAGEQGRGFAVVAGEVRGLAQRSAEAAKEIKTLITGSVEQVEQGGALADEAGRSMEEIVAAIRRVSDIVAEISAASVEQSSGVGQVEQAVSQMDQVTQQNAALVEESAAAAEALKHQAQGLVELVAAFKLAPGSRAQALHPSGEVPAGGTAVALAPAAVAPVERADPPAARVLAQPKVLPARANHDAALVKTGADDWESF
ncbi:methyl-accepting chemotaxis protein [Caldimonas tepidiphila]|uniref:methyl-accepting chemotaxis protein n=1 Tax=Caldimonas tepidiphila TaxID=2315841 RepID=UPI000E5C4022|nr:methyl-accepting chemotaxis protein [Caldimonas tepidiphila]